MALLEKWLRRALVFTFLLATPFAWHAWGPRARPYTITAAPGPAQIITTPARIDSLVAFFDSAQTSIDIWMYTITHPAMTEALMQAEARGVAVRMILEDEPFGGFGTSKENIERLQASGVEIKNDNDPLRYQHAKTALIDGARVIIGTANWTKAAFDRNREFIVIFDDREIGEQLARLFEYDWDGSSNSPLLSAPLVTSPRQSRAVLSGIINQSRERILIAVEVFNDEGIEAHLARAAERGVAVQVLMADPIDIKPNAHAAARLRKQGVQVIFQRKPFLHAKYLVSDSVTSFVGSQNMTEQSLDANREIGLVTRSPRVASLLARQFTEDWNRSQ